VDKDYRAKPELWEAAEKFGRNSMDMSNLVLELRARVEALEAAQRPVVNESVTTAPAGSLVERVGDALADEFQPSGTWHDEARAAIREVAAWLREQAPGFLTGDELIEAAHLISREAGQ
jgi:hypothetical protein